MIYMCMKPRKKTVAGAGCYIKNVHVLNECENSVTEGKHNKELTLKICRTRNSILLEISASSFFFFGGGARGLVGIEQLEVPDDWKKQ